MPTPKMKIITLKEELKGRVYEYRIAVSETKAELSGYNRAKGDSKSKLEPTFITSEGAIRLFKKMMPSAVDCLNTLEPFHGFYWTIALEKFFVVTLSVTGDGEPRNVPHLVKAQSPELAFAAAVECESVSTSHVNGQYVIPEDAVVYTLVSVLEADEAEAEAVEARGIAK